MQSLPIGFADRLRGIFVLNEGAAQVPQYFFGILCVWNNLQNRLATIGDYNRLSALLDGSEIFESPRLELGFGDRLLHDMVILPWSRNCDHFRSTDIKVRFRPK